MAPRTSRRAGMAAVGLAVSVLVAAPLAYAAPDPVVTVKLAPGTSAADLPPGAAPLVDPADAAALAGRAALRGRSVPDLTRWYRVPADTRAEARTLARTLDAPAGQIAAVQPPPPPPPRAACRRPLGEGGWPTIPVSGAVPDLSAAEEHRTGLRLPASADGSGIRVADVEYSWRPSHEELRAHDLDAPSSAVFADHGTSALSVIAGARDGQGTSGLAPGAELLPVSPETGGGYNVARAVTGLAERLRPGDILLIEQQAWADASLTRLGPVEINPEVREAIQLATAAGIVVIEPAGNGVRDGDEGIDLDELEIPLEGERGYSGAIMVGAGQSPLASGGGTDLGRESFSNYGRRVDVQGYGESVVTAGGRADDGDIGGPSADRSYTACFNGTSSAAATVAGAVAALQSFARARLGAPLDPRVLRRQIVATGLPQHDPETGSIGPRPQIEDALPPPPDPDASAPAPQPAPEPVAAAPAPPAPSTAPAAAAPVAAPAAASTRSSTRTRPSQSLRSDPAARGARATLAGRSGRLTIRLRGLAPRAVVRVGARSLRVARGRVVVSARRGGVLVLRITAPRRGNVSYRPSAFRVSVTRAGAVRVAALTSPTSRARL